MLRRRRNDFIPWLPLRRHAALLALSALLCGCSDMNFDWSFGKKKLPPEAAPSSAPANDSVLSEMIGARALYSNAEPLQLRGFGLVRGLGENGSSDCPTTIREYLVEFLTKELTVDDGRRAKPSVSPGALIDSLDTAVVSVRGLVAPGAPKSAIFDVQVEAIGNQTRSLEGGILLLTELKLFSATDAGRALIAGRALAHAHGPVYTDPQVSGINPETGSGARVGLVLGGGETLENRSVRLLLQEPSYSAARRIERRVNERFGHNPPAAEAVSRGYVELRTPSAHSDEPDHFLELISHLFIDNTPAYVERKLRELDDEVRDEEDRMRRISLAWEGLGRAALAHVQAHYARPEPAIVFHAARAGLRLKDVGAVAVMGRVAASEGPKRLEAIAALGRCRLPQAAAQLSPLLSGEDSATRIAAYDALRNYPTPVISSRDLRSALDQRFSNFRLDLVDSTGAPLIYVRQSGEPRIALFGPRMPVESPLFYSHPEERVTLNALEEGGPVTMYCRTRQRGKLSDPISTTARVFDILRGLGDLPIKDSGGSFRGLGQGYSLVVQVLEALRARETIEAALVMEKNTLADRLGSASIPERSEADEELTLTPKPRGTGAGEPAATDERPAGDAEAASDRAEAEWGRVP